MAKKCFCLILTVLLTVLAFSAFASDEHAELLYEPFDEYAVNEVPENITLDGVDARVISKNGFNKAIGGKAWGTNDFVYSKTVENASAKIVMSADVCISKYYVGAKTFSLKTTSGTIEFLTYLENGKISLPDGRIVCGHILGQWKHFDLVVNLERAELDLYVDGKSVLDNHRFSYAKYGIPMEIMFSCSAPDGDDFAEMAIDNIRVYNGTQLLPDSAFASKGINQSTVEFTETVKKPDDGKLFFNYDFSDKSELNFSPLGNTVELLKLDEKNSVLHILRNQNESQAMCEVVVPTGMYDLKKYIVQFDIMVLNNSGGVSMIEVENKSGSLSGAVSVTKNSTFYLNGSFASNFASNVWNNVAICFDNAQMTYTAYMNGKFLVTRPLPHGSAYPLRIRTRSGSGAEITEYYMDNLRAYSGGKLIEFDQTSLETAKTSPPLAETEQEAIDLIGNAKVFMTKEDTLFIDGAKKHYEDFSNIVPYTENNVFMVPDFLISKAFGCEISESGNEIFVNGNHALSIDSTVIEGSSLALEASPRKNDNIIYLPLESFCKNVLSLYSYYDERGFYVIDKDPVKLSNSEINFLIGEPIDTIYRYMQFDRPNGEEIYEDLLKTSPGKMHPRILTNQTELSRIKKAVNTDEEYRRLFETSIKDANQYIDRAVVARTTVSSNSPSFLGSARNLMAAIRTLGVAYAVTGEEIYAKRCWKEMESAMGYIDWNGDTYSMLDTSETMYGVALGYDFIYDWMTSEQKQYTIDMIFEKGLNHFIRSYTGRAVRIDWVKATGNWGCVCNGACIATALAIIDDVDDVKLEKCKFILENAVQSLEWPLMLMYPDGAWSEGPAYTEYAMSYLFGGALCSLKFACGTTYDLLDADGVKENLTATIGLQSPNGKSFNFADSAEVSIRDSYGYLIALILEDDALMSTWHAVRGNLNAASNERALLWYKPSTGGNIDNIALDNYFYSCDAGTMKSSNTIKEATYAAIKGGINGSNHDNLDLGTFVFDALGERWAYELGADNYNLTSVNYWTQHYWLYKCRPEGQNVLVINPREDDETIEYYGGQMSSTFAPLETFISKPRGCIMTLNLAEPYQSDVTEYKRGFLLSDDRQTLTVQDEFTLKEDNSKLLWFMHTKAITEISSDGKSAILTLDGKKLKVEALSNATNWHFETQEEKPLPTSPQLSDQLMGNYAVNGVRLALVAEGSGEVYITVKLSSILDYETFDSPQYIPISQWSIPDGEIPEKLRAKTICADGIELKDFERDKLNYTIDVPYGTEIPQISAEGTKGSCQVVQSYDLSVPSKVIVTEDNGKTITYTITMEAVARITDDIILGLTPVKGVPDGYRVLMPVKSSVSAVQQPDNNELRLIDGDFATRWAVEGYDVWAEVDLGAVYDISGIALGIYEGNKRQNILKLIISEDGRNYSTIFDGKSSGTSSEYESYMFDNRKVRYIRYVGNTSTVSTWNSVTELAAIVKE